MQTKVNLKWLALALLFGALTLITFSNPATAFAQQPAPNIDDQVLRIAKNLYCPVCPATPLDVCDTQACAQWRALIKDKLVAGENEQQIRADFIAQYGDRVLGAPPPEGFNLGAYVLPLLLLLAGAGIIFFTMRGWLKARAREAPPAPLNSIPAEYADRIARALEERG